MGVSLPEPAPPKGSYLPLVREGNLIFLSGVLPLVGSELLHPGRVGENVSVADAQQAAKYCIINALARLDLELSSLDDIKRWVKLVGFVASTPTFFQQPAVVNGASDFLEEVFSEKGLHARSAVGVVSLPMGSCVEIEAVVALSS